MLDATIITSLPPTMKRMVGGRDFGVVYQRACIESWVSAGFRVVSINSAIEIDQLKPLGYPVSFLTSSNVRPAITEFLDYAGQCENDFVGIINADCFFFGYPSFIDGIKQGALRGLVMVERVNIDPVSLLPTGQTCLGFDAFFFAPSMSKRIKVPSDLTVGQPWWDYWLPAAFAVEHIDLLRPQSPLVFHLDHEQGWSQERWLNTGRCFIKAFAAIDVQNRSSFLTGVRRFASEELSSREDLGGFGDWCFDWLRDNAPHLDVPADPTATELFGKILAAVANFDGMHASTLALAQARRDIGVLSAVAQAHATSAAAQRRQRIDLLRKAILLDLYLRARRFCVRLGKVLRKGV